MGPGELLIIVLLGLTLLALVWVARTLQQRQVTTGVEAAALHDGTEALLQREEELARREGELAGQEQALDVLRGELDRRDEQLSDRVRQLDDREQRLVARATEVETRADAARAERDELRTLHAQLSARDEVLARRADRLDDKQSEIERQRLDLQRERAQAESERQELADSMRRASQELERIAGMDSAQARDEVLHRAEHSARLESARLVRDVERKSRTEADAVARRIIVTAIQRLAAEQTADSVVTAVMLPSEEMKGRIIGREGRNIRTFEQITGVNVLIDDTPETVLISSFDPVRRETARVTLEALVADGRIHPSHIEEVHERSIRQVEERVLRAAEDALAEVRITDLAPELLPVLGSLQYRTSYGQNVLRHSLECAHLAAMMAAELGLDPTTSRRAALLHDIGKALTHEVEGPHAQIGADLLRRHGEDEDVVHAVAAHHNEIEPETVEALLVQAADAISGSRPGARRESLEAHVRRLERLEQIAMDQPGVDRAYAMQAGRELRIMVLPDEVDDAAARAIARDVVQSVEHELTYPGEIRVTVVRESRATAVAR
ncbi:ribonuclease Y [Aestuariimicrobium sp. p3-SID1156]|uniref:ribonuclease Y n=1 Tax=Aestuariimicrobium sp. p3-SID1156 TaxID=2916038 RepID=UPI00223C1AA8|nr:ribonuclease Y [Aestuariimicrobium sp. p3-SID1156]MCT1459100.1 ribonuclease Y [Aestuariimicrobium sp. p3-SID1156]